MNESVLDPKKLIQARGLLSQTEAALRLGITKQLLQAYESGRAYPSLKNLIRICDIYGCKFEQLLTNRNGVESQNKTAIAA